MEAKRLAQDATDDQPNDASGKAQQQRPGPTVTNPQEEEQKIGEIELLFDRECPEGSVDRVGSPRIQVVQHEEVKEDVPQVKTGDVNGRFVCEIDQIQRERGEVRRIQSPNASFPEDGEFD